MSHMHTYVRLADRSEETLAESFRVVAEGHAQAADVFHMCHTLAQMSDTHRERLGPVIDRYGEEHGDGVEDPTRLRVAGLADVRAGEIGLLRDLQDLHVLADLVSTTWTVLSQGARGLRDRDLLTVTQQAQADTARQLTWLETRMKATAPQALIVTPPAARSR